MCLLLFKVVIIKLKLNQPVISTLALPPRTYTHSLVYICCRIMYRSNAYVPVRNIVC